MEEIDDELESEFSAASDFLAAAVTSGQPGLTDAVKLQFYGLYKQATVGKCNQKQPAFWSVAARAKWDAWNKLGDLSSKEAKEQYISLLSSIASDWIDASGGGGGEGSAKKSGALGPVFSMPQQEDGSDSEDDGQSALHELAGEGDELALAALLESGVAADTRNAEGCTALHFAADRGQAATAKQLLAAGADVNAVDEDGSSPLHYAALCGHQELALLLIDAGADVRLQDSSGATAQDVGPKTWDFWQEHC